MAMIFHITRSADWVEAQVQGQYTADSLSTEGFIHCSRPDQVIATANRYYAGQHGLLLLVIAPTRVKAEMRLENLSGGEELFPHIYGPLNLDAVLAVLPFEPDADGHFTRLPAGIPNE